MKVLHLISSSGLYGAEAVILNLCTAALVGSTCALGVFQHETGEEPALYTAARQLGLEAALIPCSGRLDLGVPGRIAELVQHTDARLLHAHGYKADLYAWMARGRLAVPLVATSHTWYDNDRTSRIYGALDRRALRRFDAVIAVSEEVRARLLHAGVKPEHVHLVRNGIDTSRFSHERSYELAGRAPLVGLVGRLAPEKGVGNFLRVAAEVHAAMPEVRFLVAGEGEQRASLEALRDQLGMRDVVEMPGVLADMPAVLRSLDVLVSSSLEEGLPIALLEGMAAGLPVAATRAGAVPMVIDPDRNGLLTEPGDVVAQTAAVFRLLREADLRQRLGEAARSTVEQEFSAARMAAEYNDVYETVKRGAAVSARQQGELV